MKKAFFSLGWTTLVLFVAFLLWARQSPQGAFWSLDEGGKYIYLQSIWQSGQVNTPLIYPARALDPNLERVPLYFYILRDHQIHSWWPIALPLVSLPFYKAFGWLGLFLLPAAAGALTAWLSGILAQKLSGSVRVGWLAMLLTGLATPVAFYATRFWEHTLSTAGVLGALWGMLDADEHRRARSAVLAGLCGSLAVFFRPDAAFLLIGFGLVLLVRRPRLAIYTALSAVLASLPWMALNLWTAGHPFGPTFGKLVEADAFSGWQKAGLKLLAYALFNPPRADAFIFPRWALWTASLSLLAGVVLAFFPRLRWLSLTAFGGVIGVCGWVALQPTWYQAVHGAVLAAPQVLFGLYYLLRKPAWKHSAFPAMLAASLLVYGAVYLWRAWVGAGGLQWGPRYLLSFYPLLVIAALLELQALRQAENRRLYSGALALFVVASLIGLSFSIRGLLTARQLTEWYARGKEVLLNLDAPLVLEWQGYVMDVPDLYLSGKVVTIPALPEPRQQWETFLRGQGYDHYYSGTLLTVDNAPLEVIAERLKEHPSGVVITRVDLTGEP
ncbi:hypothetical protein [Anaerolinea sp.]|uniref:ArnT family glycosyltransferase n=1 Tax=Anaerolinea sp. TaxID=1872519 RepID=UPI002ACD43A1|nr:hypothetical protein [Anaerolinea sp.]